MAKVQLTNESCIVNGDDITRNVQRVEMSLDGKDNQVAIFMAQPDVAVEIDGAVTIVEPPNDARVMRRAVEFIRALDPTAIETVALENLGFGSPRSMTQGIMDAIVGAFTDAASQLEGAEEVRGSADDRHDLGEEAADDSD